MENKSIKKPEIVVFAGPNGSGKSTITNLLRPPMLPYINADEIQRVLDCDNMEAAKIAENRREECLEKCKGFCFETVLSTDRNLKLLKRAKDAGFFIRCYRVNMMPYFISERTPSEKREDLWELLEEVGLDYYDRFEWLLRTNMRCGTDNLIVERADAAQN